MDFFSKCEQIWGLLRIFVYFQKKTLTENFIFCIRLVSLLYIQTQRICFYIIVRRDE